MQFGGGRFGRLGFVGCSGGYYDGPCRGGTEQALLQTELVTQVDRMLLPDKERLRRK